MHVVGIALTNRVRVHYPPCQKAERRRQMTKGNASLLAADTNAIISGYLVYYGMKNGTTDPAMCFGIAVTTGLIAIIMAIVWLNSNRINN